jgi:hypothetical protein
MARVLIAFIACCFALGACTQRSICPAFQSAYIYDQEALRKKFSYFLDDSTPKVFTASKTKYLIAEPMSYRKKVRSLRTVAMKPVPVVVPDSLLGNGEDSVSMAELDRAARSVIDTITAVDVPPREPAPVATADDSVYMISKDRELRLLKYNGADSLEYDPQQEKYVAQKPEYYVKNVGLNIEQDNYMWYLRDYLVLPDVRLAKMQQSAEGKSKAVAAKRAKREKKGLKGFFKNLFKKKKEKPVDSTATPPPQNEQFDFIKPDSLSQPPPAQDEPKKEFFGPGQKAPGGQASDPALNPASDPQDKNKPGIGDAQKKRDDGF